MDLIKQLLAKLSFNKAAGPGRLTIEHLRFCDTSVSVYISIFCELSEMESRIQGSRPRTQKKKIRGQSQGHTF